MTWPKTIWVCPTCGAAGPFMVDECSHGWPLTATVAPPSKPEPVEVVPVGRVEEAERRAKAFAGGAAAEHEHREFFEERADELAGRVRSLETQLEETQGLLRELYDYNPAPCRLDHHGYCQQHGWMATEPVCPYARTKALLSSGVGVPKEEKDGA